MAKRDRTWVASMLSTDPNLQIGFSEAASFRADLNQLAHTLTIKHLKRIFRQNPAFNVAGKKTP
jgi:hypothetical protein